MRFKPVPRPADDLGALATVHDALPRVPRSESDCCTQLAERVPWIPDRDAARTWLVFLRALGLASRTDGGRYVRSESDVDPRTDVGARTLADRFADRVLAADAVRRQLDEEPRTAATVFEQVRDVVPEWEHRRATDWERRWTDRTAAVLDWWVLLGDARSTDAGYVRRSPSS